MTTVKLLEAFVVSGKADDVQGAQSLTMRIPVRSDTRSLQALSTLCTLLVDEHYGPLASHIFHTLTIHGRCTFRALQAHSKFDRESLGSGLATLVQRNLVYWYIDGVASYEPNQTTAYSLSHHGILFRSTSDRFTSLAARVVSHLQFSGPSTVDSILQACTGHSRVNGARKPLVNGDFANGETSHGHDSEIDESSQDECYQALCDLLQAGFIRKTHESFFRTPADNVLEAQKFVKPIDEYQGIKKERQARRDHDIESILHEWRYGTMQERAEVARLGTGKKRLLEDGDSVQPNKKARITNGTPHGRNLYPEKHAEHTRLGHAGILPPSLNLCINNDRFAVHLRNERLSRLAEERIGPATARVYSAILSTTEPHLLDSKSAVDDNDKFEEHAVSTEEIARTIPDTEDFRNSLAAVHGDDIEEGIFDHPKKRRRKLKPDGHLSDDGGRLSEDAESDTASDASIALGDEDDFSEDPDFNPFKERSRSADYSEHHRAVQAHLLLLAQHPMKFVKRLFVDHVESWTVKFAPLVKTLQMEEIRQTLHSRYGQRSVRLANILTELGKLDDKTLSSLSLTKEKDVRALCIEMQRGGLLELQEVPRDNARLASRTNFLFFFDHERCIRRLTEDCYKTMTRLLQRARMEREQVQTTIDKANRSDVIGREDQFLSKAERQALAQYRTVEEKLWGQMARVDDVVAVFRDF